MAKKKQKDSNILYAIQRKSDNQFLKIPSDWGKAAVFTTDLNECILYKNVGGAKTSRGWHDTKIVANDACAMCIAGRPHDANHWDHVKRVKMTEEELPYRIVPVKVVLKLVETK